MATALVTGATGMLGHCLVEYLRSQNWRVIAIHQSTSNPGRLLSWGAEAVVADITDRASLLHALPHSVDVVFNAASFFSLWRGDRRHQRRVNGLGIRNIFYAAQEMKAKCVVHASIASVFSPSPNQLFTEASPRFAEDFWVDAVSSRRLGEDYVRALCGRGIDGIIVNLGCLLGPYDKGHWRKIFNTVERQSCSVIPPGGTCFTHAPSAAKAMVRAAEAGRNGDNYLLGGPYASYLEIRNKIANLLNRPAAERATASWRMRLMATRDQFRWQLAHHLPDITPEFSWYSSRSLRFDSAKAHNELGYDPPDLDQALAQTWDWLQGNEALQAPEIPLAFEKTPHPLFIGD